MLTRSGKKVKKKKKEYEKLENVNTQNDYETTNNKKREQTHPVFTSSRKLWKGGER